MPIRFSVRLSDRDMYRFNLYHAYTSMQGILSVVVAALIVFVTIRAGHRLESSEILMYLALALVFLIYLPVSLKIRSKKQIALSQVLQNTLYYTLTEEGIQVATQVSEETALLPWDMVYKIVCNSRQILIYSNRVNAYVIPKEAVAGEQDAIFEVFRSKLEDFRLRLK